MTNYWTERANGGYISFVETAAGRKANVQAHATKEEAAKRIESLSSNGPVPYRITFAL